MGGRLLGAANNDLTGLINEMLDGKREQFELVYPLVIKRLIKMAAFRKLSAGVSAETTEIADDALLQIYNARSSPKFDDREKFYSYAYRVVSNNVNDRHRLASAKRRIPPDELKSLSLLDSLAVTVDGHGTSPGATVVELLDELEQISEDIATVFRAHYVLQQSMDEIATGLNRSREEIVALWKAAVVYAKKRLRTESS